MKFDKKKLEIITKINDMFQDLHATINPNIDNLINVSSTKKSGNIDFKDFYGVIRTVELIHPVDTELGDMGWWRRRDPMMEEVIGVGFQIYLKKIKLWIIKDHVHGTCYSNKCTYICTAKEYEGECNHKKNRSEMCAYYECPQEPRLS